LIGAGDKKKINTVFLIDFGLSKRFTCPKTGKHVEYVKKTGFTGTFRYCSFNACKRYE